MATIYPVAESNPFERRESLQRRAAKFFAALLAPALLAALFCFASAQGAEAGGPSARVIPSSEPGWPQFRGPRRDGTCDETGLLRQWPEGGPKLLWRAGGLGFGYSSPIISGGRIYITGDQEKELRIFALDMQGRHLWRSANGQYWKEPYPGARSSVAFSGGKIYSLNAHGRLACLDAHSGKEIWQMNILERFGAKNIEWGISECLLVDERNVYATAGGREALFVALDKATGKLRWKSDPLYDTEGERDLESASYVAPVLVEFAGRRLLLGCSARHLVCADAHTGRIQWARRIPTTYLTLACSPALVGRDCIFMTGPVGQGGKLFRLLPPRGDKEPVGAEEVWRTRLDTAHGGFIYLDGRIYGSLYPDRKGWAAVDGATGEILFTEPSYVKGSFIWADGRFYVLCEDGLALLLEPAQKSFVERGRFRLVEGRARDAWAHPVIHDGRLYLRYHDTLYCYDIRAR